MMQDTNKMNITNQQIVPVLANHSLIKSLTQ